MGEMNGRTLVDMISRSIGTARDVLSTQALLRPAPNKAAIAQVYRRKWQLVREIWYSVKGCLK